MKIDSSHFHNSSIRKLSHVGEYLKHEGYHLNGTRIKYYLEILNRFLKRPELNDEEAWALVELNEMYVILKAAERYGSISRKEISFCLKGAHLLASETSSAAGNKARNYCFQLYVIANMLAFGMKTEIPSHGEEADIRFLYERMSIPVECKRLFAEGGVGTIVKKACSQVSKRVIEGGYGIAAISLSREFWIVEKNTVMDSVQDARFSVEKLYRQWRNILEDLLGEYPRVALVYINFQVPIVGPDNTYSVYERKFFKTRLKYDLLPEAGVSQHFIDSMMTLSLMEEINSDE
ncbi:hypothetical protein [Pseudomonas brassicacearum]|uniref:hypothetical protein n=1 Tax=Pseudomonas brassicacearum TaxID=930166 RepID=UPI000481C6D5|nr:hypothetical protein [Pseudomonas brassicacearum]